MRRRIPSLPRLLSSFVVVASCGASAVACSTDFDTTREARPAKTTLGEDMFSALCDRVGSSSFTEDLEGLSYRGICHKSAKGWTVTKVDTKVLPPASSSGKEARRLSIAKLEAMARRRADLIEAFDALFPDVDIDDPRDGKKKVKLHDALDLLTKRLTPLYESSPYSTKASPDAPLIPASTQTIAQTLAALADSDEAQQALARIAGRQGYRPSPMALGALRTVLAYPGLRKFSQVLLDRTGPGGPLEGKLQHLLRVAEQELRTLTPDPKQPALTIDEDTLQPNRARMKLEILSSLLLSQDSAFARSKASSRYIAARDVRGFAVPAGAKPGTPGAVPQPFVDSDNDGFADVDLLGRFVGKDGQPVPAPPPFARPWVTFDEDTFSFDDKTGRAVAKGNQLVFNYVDTSQTLLSSVLVDLKPLAASQGDGPSTLMKALEGSYVLYGNKKSASRDYGKKPDGVTIDYQGFDSDSSPLLDLTHATGLLLGAPESDDYLGSMLELHEQHPEKTGRALALGWAMWNKSKDPQYAQAVLADTSTFWDDMADFLAKVARVGPEKYTGAGAIAQPRGLLADLTLALASPSAAKYLPDAFGAPMTHSDRLSYQPQNVNGAPLDVSTGKAVTASQSFAINVDRSKPDQGDNRSAFQRFAHIISAANHVNACNKPKALVKSDLSICGINIPLTYPIKLNPFGDQPTIDECDLFEIRDLGVFFIDSVLPFNHPRRGHLVIKDSTLTGIVGVVDKLVPSICGDLNIDAILQGSTGLNGLTTTPTPQALTRLVFFGARSVDENGNPKYSIPPTQLDPLANGQNKGLATFVENSLDLVGTSGCPQDSKGVNVCASWEQTLRGIEPGTFFVSETPFIEAHPPECKALCDSLPSGSGAEKHTQALCYEECAGPTSGFYEGIRPVLTAFASYSYDPAPGEVCPKDPVGRCVGEQLFIDLIGILDKHWGGQSSGLYRYEELLAWAFSNQNDLFGVVQDLVPTLRDQQYVSHRVKKGQIRSGLEVSRSLVSFLMDPDVAQSLGVKDRHGVAAGARNDGTPKAQVTPYDLLVRALRGMDKRFEGKDDAKAHWRQARSELVDQFLLADGTAWKNPAIARALPILGRIAREQVNANCPDRETTSSCPWATQQLAKKLGDVVDGPLFSAINDLNEALRADDEARLELEKLISYLIEQADDAEALSLTLASLGDLLQVLNDDGNLAPVLNTMSVAAAPGLVDGEKSDSPGMAHVSLKLLKVMLDDHPELPEKQAAEATIDRYHVLDVALKNLVTPPADGKQAPLEVILDTIADVQRIDSSETGPLTADDYRSMATGLKTFMLDEYRGMEQFYTIVRRRNEQ